MHNDLPLSDEQLRLATTRRLPDDAPLDAETAALRERFLTLGDQLEARAADFDEQALVRRLLAALPAPAVPPAAAPRRPVVLPWLLAAALAASALVAIVRIAQHTPAGGPPAVAEAAPKTQPAAAPAPATAIARWEDSLDYEIASAQAEIERLQGRKPTLDSSLWDMNDRLRGLSSELETDPL